MIEPEAIEPEAVPPAPEPHRRRRAVIASLTLVAVVAGGIAVAADGRGPEAKPLALMAGNGAGGGAETMAARSGSPAVAPSQATVGDSRAAGLSYPYGGWALKFEVEGQLPDLPGDAAAWRVTGPSLDRAAAARIAEALGVNGTPVQRDGGWFVDDRDWTLSASGGDAFGKGADAGSWSISLYRRHDRRPDDAPTGPAISRAEAEGRVRELLERIGAPGAQWKFETTETEINAVWGCAARAAPRSPEELKRLEAQKLQQLERENRAAAVASCPPPPPAIKGFTVALHPLLDGRRADWAVWNVTVRSDGQIEGLYGSWVTFARAGDYKLRGVDAALKDLQSPPAAFATDMPTGIEPAAPPPPSTAAGSVEGSGSAASALGRLPGRDQVASSPGVGLPDVAQACPPVPMPMPAEKAASSPAAAPDVAPVCVPPAPPAPQVVKITGVELGLIQTSVFEDGQIRLALVPSYRFVGRFDNGSGWETSVIALHPDAIAPPPDVPVADVGSGAGGGVTGVGKAVPPAPAPEPAVLRG